MRFNILCDAQGKRVMKIVLSEIEEMVAEYWSA
jgi:hypothetical protein